MKKLIALIGTKSAFTFLFLIFLFTFQDSVGKLKFTNKDILGSVFESNIYKPHTVLWSWPQCRNTNGVSPTVTSAYLGDQVTLSHDSWAEVDTKWPKWQVFIHTSSDIQNGLSNSWSGYSNVQTKTSVTPSFTSIGTWYWGFKVEYTDAGGTTCWYCQNDNNWNNMWGTPTSNLTITVSALPDPTGFSASKDVTLSSTKINLSWALWASHNVMVVRNTTGSFTNPAQGTAYTAGNTIGSDVVVYQAGSATGFSDNNLVPGQTYYYKIYTENYSYYSAGVTSGAVTLDALPKPTGCSASAVSSSQINLAWTQNANYQTVMVVSRLGSDMTADPSNGTSYIVGNSIGSGNVIYKGTLQAYNNTGLSASTQYYYRYYTVTPDDKYYSVPSGGSTQKNAITFSAPVVSGFTASGYAGSSITITGTYFTGTTTVSFGGTAAQSFTVDNDNQITAILAGGTSGTVSVTSPNGTGTLGGFTFLGYISNANTAWSVGTTWLGGNVPPSGAFVTINNDVILDMSTSIASITINPSASLTSQNGLAYTLTVNTGGTFTNSGTLTANDGKVSFAGTGTVSGTIAFNNVDISGGVDFGTGSTLGGILSLNSGSWINTHAPAYAANSTLKYNIGAVYGRNTEWNGTSVPYNVQLSNNTTLNFSNGSPGVACSCTGNLTIDSGSSLYMDYGGDNMTQPLTVNGNLVQNGNLSLSGASGGDLILKGNFTRTGTFSNNGRMVTFNGTTDQLMSGAATFGFVTVNKTSGKFTFDNTFTINNNITLTSGSLVLTQADQISSAPFIFNGGDFSSGNTSGYGEIVGTLHLTDNSAIHLGTGSHSLTFANSSAVGWTAGKTLTVYGWTGTMGNSGTGGKIFVGAGGLTSGQLSQITFDGFAGKAMLLGTGEIVPEVIFYTVQDGDWNDPLTWFNNAVPDNTKPCNILHAVTLNATPTNSASNLTINTGKSLTFSSSAVLTLEETTTNKGTINMTSGGTLSISNGGTLTNAGTFTGGTGKVAFAGAGVLTGILIFNNLDIAGALTQNATASINGILQVNGGYLLNNSITYNSGSTLKYLTNYDINSGDKLWFSNTASTGIAQSGIPWNVEIGTLAVVQLNDHYPFYINGNLVNAGTFRLGMASSPNFGDFYLKGNFVNNGTFNHNSRALFFNGTINQQISGTSTPTSFINLVINNSANLTLLQNIIVSSNVTFINGKILLGNYNADLTSATISNPTTSNYFVTDGTGCLIQNVASSEITFPIGTLTSYAPAYLTQSSTSGNVSVRVQNTFTNPPANNSFAVNMQWTVDNGADAGSQLTTKFQWNTADEGTNFLNNIAVYIGHYTGSYTTASATVAGSNPYTAYAPITGALTDIPFIIGNSSAFASNVYMTQQNGDWNTGSTWVGGLVPPVNSICNLLHHVTVSAPILDASEIIIYSDKSLTFNAAGSVTVNGNISNLGMLETTNPAATVNCNGTLKNYSSLNMAAGGILNFSSGSTFTNTGSFTSGSGIVNFQSTGTATGTLGFNDITVSGNVDLGSAASLNGTLTLNSGGDLINNSISYTIGSTLKFNRSYNLANDKIWLRNTVSTGTEQIGIPWNIEMVSGATVQYSATNDYREINGSLTIDNGSTFALGDGTNAGDFRLRKNFIDNGTFMHQNKEVDFIGTSNQQISGTNSPLFYNLKINNAANVTLANTVTAANNLDLSGGKMILGNYNVTVASVVNYGSTNYVVTNGNGYLIQNINPSTGKYYPIGTLYGYNPANLTQGVGAIADNIWVRVQNSIDNSVNDPTQIVNMQWVLNEAVIGGNDLTTQFQWNASDEASGFVRTGTVETSSFSGGTYTNIASTEAGSNPYTATANTTFTANLSSLPFIVANLTAFSGGIITAQDGLWNTGSTWIGNVPPTTGQSAVIKHNVTLDTDPSVKSISVISGSLNCGTHTLTVDNGGAIANSGIFTAGTGKVVFSGAGTISTGTISFNNVDINGAVSFGSKSTINGTLKLNAGGSVATNPPLYGNGSTLQYYQSGSVNRGNEWLYNISSTDPGCPYNVQISNSTSLNIGYGGGTHYYETRIINGSLIVDNLSACGLGSIGGGVTEDQNCGLYVKGDINNNGTINLSTSAGGDMMLEGSINNTGTINFNSRAVFFTGSASAVQNISGLSLIPFILITNGANVKLSNDLSVNGSGTEFITFARPSSTYTGSIDLNGHKLNCSGNGNIELNNISGAQIYGAAGSRIEIGGGNCTYSGTTGGTLGFGSDVTLAINGGTMTFPSTLGIVTIYGTFEIGEGATVTNIPTYGANSILHYAKGSSGGSFNVGNEWPAGSTVADNIPHDVMISQGSTPADLILNTDRSAIGTLTVQNNATLEVSALTGQLSVNNLTVESGGKIVLKSPSDDEAAGSLITTGTVTNNGTMQAERFLSANEYYLITPPNVVSSSTVFTSHSGTGFNPNLYYYNESFDAPVDPSSANYSGWSNAVSNFKNAWLPAHDGSTGTGITLNITARGYSFYDNESKMCVFDGKFNSGDQSINIYYDLNDGNGGYYDGWNLLANPFPSALDWESSAWDKSNIENAIYYYDGLAGNYKYYITSGTSPYDCAESLNGGSRYIPASQGFWIKAASSAATTLSGGTPFIIPNAARLHSAQNFWKKSQSKTQINSVKLSAEANNLTDETVIRFIPGASSGYDGNYDCYKKYSYVSAISQLYSFTQTDSAGLAINSLDTVSENISIPLGFEIAKNGENKCSVKIEDYTMPDKFLILEDKLLNVSQNLRTEPEYQFSVNGPADVRNRFVLHFNQNHAPISSGINNQTAYYQQDFMFKIPDNTFTDIDAGDSLVYSVDSNAGNGLPTWLNFNAATQTFSGKPDLVETFTVKVKATDILGASVSQNFNITVMSVLANIQTLSVSQITQTSAQFDADITFEGGSPVSQAGFCYATHDVPDLTDSVTTQVPILNHIQNSPQNLIPNTNYYVRAYAYNLAGLQYGNTVGFSTKSVDVANLNENEFRIYPNPTSGKISLNLKNQSRVRISVIDFRGVTVRIFNVNHPTENTKLDLSKLSDGIYCIEIETSSEKIFKSKVIINK